jgi:hypothetical protein
MARTARALAARDGNYLLDAGYYDDFVGREKPLPGQRSLLYVINIALSLKQGYSLTSACSYIVAGRVLYPTGRVLTPPVKGG